MPRCYPFRGNRPLIAALLFLLLCAAQEGRSQPPVSVQPDPQAPSLALTAPLGMQRGTSLELTLNGANLADPTGLWTSFPAKVTIPADNNNGKDNAKLRVRMEVPPEAPIGFQTIRLATRRGVSNVRLFCIDDLPQVLGVASNHSRAVAQALPVPCVVVGRTDAETCNYYKIAVKAGQRVSFEVLGRRLGSPLDPQLTLYDARTQRELEGGHSNDAPGLQADPRLTYTFRQAGEYVIEVRDAIWRGGPDFFYRLRMGDFPCASAALPMAARRGTAVAVRFAGPNVAAVGSVNMHVPADPRINALWVAPQADNGLHGWPVALQVTDMDELLEEEPNDLPSKASRVALPGGVTGVLRKKGDIDHFAFTAQKGRRYWIEMHTHEWSSPAEVYLVLKNTMGGQVAVANSASETHLDFTAPTDGDFVLEVQHLLYGGGPTEAYHLSIVPYEPGFDLAAAIDRAGVPQGASTVFSVTAARRDYTGPIELTALSDPGITGQATIEAGQVAGLLPLAAAPNLPLGPHSLVIQGKAIINGQTVIRYASARKVVSQALGGLANPPPMLFHELGLAVTRQPPFTLAAKFDQAQTIRGSPATLTITALRTGGFFEEITLAPLGLPPNVAPAFKNIARGQNVVTAQLTPAVNAALGRFPIAVTGSARWQNESYSVAASPVLLDLVLPFDLHAEPTPLVVAPGASAMLKLTASRKGGYQGPIAVEVANLPAGLTASKSLIAPGQQAGQIEVTAAANAVLGDMVDVRVVGTATAAANQQSASAAFGVRVIKK